MVRRRKRINIVKAILYVVVGSVCTVATLFAIFWVSKNNLVFIGLDYQQTQYILYVVLAVIALFFTSLARYGAKYLADIYYQYLDKKGYR